MYLFTLLGAGLVFSAMFIVLAALTPTLQVAGGLSGACAVRPPACRASAPGAQRDLCGVGGWPRRG